MSESILEIAAKFKKYKGREKRKIQLYIPQETVEQYEAIAKEYGIQYGPLMIAVLTDAVDGIVLTPDNA